MIKFITEKELLELIKDGTKELYFKDKVNFTPAAKDLLKQYGIKINYEVNSKQLEKYNEKVFTIAIGSDHTGYKVKNEVKNFLLQKNYHVEDVGTLNENSCDYPDFAFNVANLVSIKKANRGILFDAIGNPSAICANKVKGIRAVVAINEFSIKSSREHNNSNILTIGARIFDIEYIKSLIDLWLSTPFLGERHQKRIDKIDRFESKIN